MPTRPGRPIDDVKRLRTLRNPRARDLTISGEIKDLERAVKRLHKQVGALGGAWAEVLPPALSAACTPVSFTRGLLTIRARDAAARFELDRWLRAGGESRLAQRAGVPIRKVKIV